MTTATPGPNLENIQGNIFSGFAKDYQTFLFLRFPYQETSRDWLRALSVDVATSQEVSDFNRLFKRIKDRRREEGVVKATWLNVAFTHAGLQALGLADADLALFPAEFQQGMPARAGLVGDNDDSAPENWIPPLQAQSHALLLIAADDPDDLEAEVSRRIDQLVAGGVELIHRQEGKTRADDRGHEHFGFLDGVSQPGVLGVTPPSDPINNPQQGAPGQDLIQPGEFVLGYDTQSGPAPEPSPAWTRDGSYLVFRRLRQDVQGFRAFVAEQAASQGISEDVMGAKLVGRYRSGSPLERTKDEPADYDPAQHDPIADFTDLHTDAMINNFEYGEDKEGNIVPRAAHIRKAYPRDQVPPGETATQTHRLLRRGIPFGESFSEEADSGSPQAGDAQYPVDRGLLFLCYQRSIADQFEFVQRFWVNNPNFPQAGDGHDPIIAQADATRTFFLPGGAPDHLTLMQRWVITTGGDYFFAPSLDALGVLSG